MRDEHKPVPPNSDLSLVTAHFAQIASSIEAGKAQAAVMALMEQTEQLCRQAVSAQAGELKELLPNLVTALHTWRTVWPRLGKQQAFRLAVVREARLWSERIGELAQRIRSVEHGRNGTT